MLFLFCNNCHYLLTLLITFKINLVCLDSEKSIYTSEKRGSDETGDGSEQKPFKTVLQALRQAEKEPWPSIYVDAKEEGKVKVLLECHILLFIALLKKT